MEDLNNVIEAILFALGREISTEEIANTLGIEEKYIKDSLEMIREKYNENSGI